MIHVNRDNECPRRARIERAEIEDDNSVKARLYLLAARFSPEACFVLGTSRSERAQGMPGARCTRGLVCSLR